MTLIDFLEWSSTTPGAAQIVNFLVGAFESLAVEWVPEFKALPPRWKRVVQILLSFAVPVLAIVALQLLGQLELSIEVVWQALAAGFAAFTGSQVSHMRQLKRKNPLQKYSMGESWIPPKKGWDD